jgi:phage terminase large subunit
MATGRTIKVEIPEKLGFLFEPHQYKVAYGGRAGGKSWSFARALVILAAQRKLRILCCREIQKSIADSVHKVLVDQIDTLGLRDKYIVTATSIRGVNGSEFFFSGLKTNLMSIKSMESIDIVWVEEAQSVSAESIGILIPTIRKEGSELWFSFNPYLEVDEVYKMFVASKPEGAKVVRIGWEDNPWLSSVSRKDKDNAYENDPDAANHIWGGDIIRNNEAQVLCGKWRVESFEPDEDEWDGPYFGIDWGFGTTPTVMIKCWAYTKSMDPPEKELYIEYEAQGIGIDIVDTPELFDTIPDARLYTARADCARPETISHMVKHGYKKVTACEKYPGSVEDGIEFLRSFKSIIIHPRCKLTVDQAKLYMYKVDRGGNLLPIVAKKHDDVWDATRYALEPVIRNFLKEKKPEERRKPRDRWAEHFERMRKQGSESWKTA